MRERQVPALIVCTIVDDSLSDTSPLGDAIETFLRHEDAERFIAEVRHDAELASYLWIEEGELEAEPPARVWRVTARSETDEAR